MTTYELSSSAYHLLLLHAKQYVHAITGLLLGKKSSNHVQITQVLPLAHSDLTVHTTPVTETGLHLSEHFATAKGVSIVGLYYANEVIDDKSLPTHAVRIADRIRERFADALILRVDGTKLKPDAREREHCLVVYHGEGWKRRSVDGLVTEHALRSLDKALCIDGVRDFEDHLLDPCADWLNTDVIKALEAS